MWPKIAIMDVYEESERQIARDIRSRLSPVPDAGGPETRRQSWPKQALTLGSCGGLPET